MCYVSYAQTHDKHPKVSGLKYHHFGTLHQSVGHLGKSAVSWHWPGVFGPGWPCLHIWLSSWYWLSTGEIELICLSLVIQ